MFRRRGGGKVHGGPRVSRRGGLRLRALPFALVIASLLAGCADVFGDDGGPDLGPALSDADALRLLKEASAASPGERWGFETVIANGSREIFRVRSDIDAAAGVELHRLSGDPAAFPGRTAEERRNREMLGAGVVVLVRPTGQILYANGTAAAVQPSQTGRASFVGEIDPRGLLGNATNGTVESVRLVASGGTAAVELEARSVPGRTPDLVKVVVLRSPPRLARLSLVYPANPSDPADPFRGSTVTSELRYGAEVSTEPPEAVARAEGLRYAVTESYTAAGPKRTFTFQSSAGVAPADVEAHVKTGDEAADPKALATNWTFRLSDASRERGGVRLAFDDADRDGKISAGDALVVERLDRGDLPFVALYDAKTGTYLVPGLGAAGLALLAAGAAILRRR